MDTGRFVVGLSKALKVINNQVVIDYLTGNFTKSMVARAVQCFGKHSRYQTFYNKYKDVLNSGYDGCN